MPDNRKAEELVTLIEVDSLARADLLRSVLQGSGILLYPGRGVWPGLRRCFRL